MNGELTMRGSSVRFCIVIFACVLLVYICKELLAQQETDLEQEIQWRNQKDINYVPAKFRIRQNGKFWILENYIQESRQYGEYETVTYTTHGDYTFLVNLEPLIDRWQAPISIALFAPGSDFNQTLDSIRYLRMCSKQRQLITDLVTFHIFFPDDHLPSYIPKTQQEIFTANIIDCTVSPPYNRKSLNSEPTYRHRNNLTYAINLARNIARLQAQSYYIFPSDIELYPSLNFVPQFLQMVKGLSNTYAVQQPRVFPLAVFEIEKGYSLPVNKTQLQDLFQKQIIIPFHRDICMQCHAIPDLDLWILKPEQDSMSVFKIAKRNENYAAWEPFYVTTKYEPLFDERFTWEGQYDKRILADLLSMLDYEFHILDKAFLVHRPGIKVYHAVDSETQARRNDVVSKARTEFVRQLNILYGSTRN